MKKTANLPINASSMQSLDRNAIKSHVNDMRMKETKGNGLSSVKELEDRRSPQDLLCTQDLNSLVGYLQLMLN